jgi:hypothetical protein
MFTYLSGRAAHVPPHWIPHYLEYSVPAQRWDQFETSFSTWRRNRDASRIQDFPVTNGAVAGLLLNLMGIPADTLVRQHLLSWARQDPMGSYFLAEGLHLPEERPTILHTVRANPRLLYWLSQLPGFAQSCIHVCSAKPDLWAGLTLVHHAVSRDLLETWLHRTISAAPHEPEAACAALVLQPHADAADKSVWLKTLGSAPAVVQAFEALWWARHTWCTGFEGLFPELVAHATKDYSVCWYNWAVLHPDWALHEFSEHPVNPLWAVEFLEEMRLASKPVDSTALRKQMVVRLNHDCKDHIAALVLDFLNTRGSR